MYRVFGDALERFSHGMSTSVTESHWDRSTSATGMSLSHNDPVFESLFERSKDAIWLYDPDSRLLVDCNQSALKLIGAKQKRDLLPARPEDISPRIQPGGLTSDEKTDEVLAIVEKEKGHYFEWVVRRVDGVEIPVEVSATQVLIGGKKIHVIISREISERKKAERELLELTQALERRVVERTAALTTSEARFRALVENAPEAIVVYSVDTGRFLFGNQHACDFYGVSMEKLAELTPLDVSPEFQPCGRRTSDLAREKIKEVLDGGIAVFEWVHQKPDGTQIPAEVRLLRLPAENQNLIRASIIDNTERKRAERALRESEAKFRALFEGSSQGVVLQDENRLIGVNPAAVRIMRRKSADEMLGKRPGEMAPALQPNGETSAVLARTYIEECMAKGSARFEWVAAAPDEEEIPLEVALTRIEWSGREVIQAFITDITERKRAQAALAESEARFSAAFQAGPVFSGVSRMSDGAFVLVNDAFVNWSGYSREEMLGRTSAELDLWQSSEERDAFWVELRKTGVIRGRECRVRNRNGSPFTILMSSKIIQINNEPHMLSIALDITRRKEADAQLVASEARLRESEARFSTAFHASPALIGILSMSDGRYVLANDAHLNWLGYPREEVVGRTCLELGMWENPAERDQLLKEIVAAGSVRQRECVWKNRRGDRFTVLLSAETITLGNLPHMLVMALDITQRKRAEEELRASETRLRESDARFSVAFQASPVFIGILRMEDGAYVLANDPFLHWIGYPQDEVIGRTSAQFQMWVNSDERDRALHDMRTVGRIRQREVRWRNRAGETLTILLSAETIHLENTPHILSFGQDITQRKRAEVELLKTLEREKELSQLKSNFVSMVSHEFRTPLGIIQSSSELLRDFFEKMQPTDREEQLESIIRNTGRMAGMMEEVLVLSRLDAGKLNFQPAAIDLDEFCRRVVDEVLSATNRRCPISLSVNGLPGPAQADERLLGHIFTNLLSNAVKYSDPQTPVRLSVERQGSQAVCIVEDNGIGISDEDQRQLFKAFHRGANVGTRPGTGLGLLLVKRCADLHGASLRLESAVGKGTSVRITFPAFMN